MPYKSGVEVLESMKRLYTRRKVDPFPRVVFLSAYIDEQMAREINQIYKCNFMLKPISEA